MEIWSANSAVQSLQAVIDALTAIVAVVDEAGNIIAVNRAWHAFADSSGFANPEHGLLTNYLEVCDRAGSNTDASLAAGGIRAVLQGRRNQFQLEYECHSPHQQRWFRMTVSRFEDAGRARAVITHEMQNQVVAASETPRAEELFAELCAAFVRATINEIDSQIDEWMRRIVLALRVDRGAVAQRRPSDGALVVTHSWAREGAPSIPKGPEPAKVLPWLASRVLAGETVVFSRLAELPPEASSDLEIFRRRSTKSNVTIPLKIGGVVVGAVTFCAIFRERSWPPRLLARLNMVAAVFAGALERKRAIGEFRRLEEHMRRISGVVTMGELTASLAHELNQPLGAILNNAEAARRLLAERKPDLKEVTAALEDIIRDNARAVETIRNVRALFHRGETKMSPLDLRQLLRNVERILRTEAATKGISLRVELPPSLAPVLGDKTQLIQVLMNLVLNAFDSVCENGDGPREVELRAEEREPGLVHVAVRDSGKGIEPKILPRLFDPFFTTKAEGMGMGLAIARSIIENHGGRLRAMQNPDGGATLEFALPVAGGTGKA